MKTIRKVAVKHCFCEQIPEKEDMLQNTIYISKEYGCAAHLCLCGCGNLAITSLQPVWKDGWQLIEESNGTISMVPSILNTNCPNRYHYIITSSIANIV